VLLFYDVVVKDIMQILRINCKLKSREVDIICSEAVVEELRLFVLVSTCLFMLTFHTHFRTSAEIFVLFIPCVVN